MSVTLETRDMLYVGQWVINEKPIKAIGWQKLGIRVQVGVDCMILKKCCTRKPPVNMQLQ